MSLRAGVLSWIATLLCPFVCAGLAVDPPDPATLLRRADQVRNPHLGTVLDLRLSVTSRSTGRELRSASYTLLTHRRGRALLLMRHEDPPVPGALLIAEDAYHLLLPRAGEPVELPSRLVVAGDLSHAGFLRVRLWRRFEARYAGEETIGGVPCWRLELTAKEEGRSGALPFRRVRYWVARQDFLPLRLEFFASSGELLKTARFTAYQGTAFGRRPARIEIEDAGRPDERAVLTVGEPQGAPTSRLDFDLEDLYALRSAGRRLGVESRSPPGGMALVEALTRAARAREARRGP